MNFRSHYHKTQWSEARRLKFSRPLEAHYGQPFPQSWWMFRFLYSFEYAQWKHNHAYVEACFDEVQPDLLVVVHVQNGETTPYIIAAQRRGIPILGIVASWDQPTTAGPLPPGLHQIVVENDMMIDHLVGYHQVEKNLSAILDGR